MVDMGIRMTALAVMSNTNSSMLQIPYIYVGVMNTIMSDSEPIEIQ